MKLGNYLLEIPKEIRGYKYPKNMVIPHTTLSLTSPRIRRTKSNKILYARKVQKHEPPKI